MPEMTTTNTKFNRTISFLNYIHNDHSGKLMDTGMHTYMDVIRLFINNDQFVLDTYNNYINMNPSYHFPLMDSLKLLIDGVNYFKQYDLPNKGGSVSKRSFEYQFCLNLWLDIYR